MQRQRSGCLIRGSSCGGPHRRDNGNEEHGLNEEPKKADVIATISGEEFAKKQRADHPVRYFPWSLADQWRFAGSGASTEHAL